ncbi:MAG: acyltransferase [Salibacteraceae bacterium]
MKTLLEILIRFRNPQFRFDSAVDGQVLWALILDKGMARLRGLRLLLTGRQPKAMMLGKGVRFFCRHNIRWGKQVKLEDQVYLSGLGTGLLQMGDNVGIGAHSRVVISTSFQELGSHITIGNHVGIGEFAYLGGAGGLEIGDECIIGQYFSCHPENHHYQDSSLAIRHQGVTRKGIKVGANCWIGSKVTLLDGVTVGEGCVIAAGAVVTRSIPAHSVAAGVPAKVIAATKGQIKAA